MFEKLNKEIADVKEKLRRKEKLQSLLRKTKEDLNDEMVKRNDLHRTLKREKKDVDRLESTSITGLFYSILGNKEQQLEKERQEYLGAKLKFDECVSLITTLEKEIISYNEELQEYWGIEEQYKELMKSKERLILQGGDLKAKRLVELTERASDLKSNIKETKEAISAGERVSGAFQKVIDSLQSAKGWGQWDMLGGGFLATAAKHSKIDEAKSNVYEAQRLLGQFKRELSDVNLSSNVEINVGSFATFADYFFDNLISDWVVQSRINDSLNNVHDTYNNVNRLLNTLDINLNNFQRELVKVEAEISGIIED